MLNKLKFLAKSSFYKKLLINAGSCGVFCIMTALLNCFPSSNQSSFQFRSFAMQANPDVNVLRVYTAGNGNQRIIPPGDLAVDTFNKIKPLFRNYKNTSDGFKNILTKTISPAQLSEFILSSIDWRNYTVWGETYNSDMNCKIPKYEDGPAQNDQYMSPPLFTSLVRQILDTKFIKKKFPDSDWQTNLKSVIYSIRLLKDAIFANGKGLKFKLKNVAFSTFLDQQNKNLAKPLKKWQSYVNNKLNQQSVDLPVLEHPNGDSYDNIVGGNSIKQDIMVALNAANKATANAAIKNKYGVPDVNQLICITNLILGQLQNIECMLLFELSSCFDLLTQMSFHIQNNFKEMGIFSNALPSNVSNFSNSVDKVLNGLGYLAKQNVTTNVEQNYKNNLRIQGMDVGRVLGNKIPLTKESALLSWPGPNVGLFDSLYTTKYDVATVGGIAAGTTNNGEKHTSSLFYDNESTLYMCLYEGLKTIVESICRYLIPADSAALNQADKDSFYIDSALSKNIVEIIKEARKSNTVAADVEGSGGVSKPRFAISSKVDWFTTGKRFVDMKKAATNAFVFDGSIKVDELLQTLFCGKKNNDTIANDIKALIKDNLAQNPINMAIIKIQEVTQGKYYLSWLYKGLNYLYRNFLPYDGDLKIDSARINLPKAPDRYTADTDARKNFNSDPKYALLSYLDASDTRENIFNFLSTLPSTKLSDAVKSTNSYKSELKDYINQYKGEYPFPVNLFNQTSIRQGGDGSQMQIHGAQPTVLLTLKDFSASNIFDHNDAATKTTLSTLNFIRDFYINVDYLYNKSLKEEEDAQQPGSNPNKIQFQGEDEGEGEKTIGDYIADQLKPLIVSGHNDTKDKVTYIAGVLEFLYGYGAYLNSYGLINLNSLDYNKIIGNSVSDNNPFSNILDYFIRESDKKSANPLNSDLDYSTLLNDFLCTATTIKEKLASALRLKNVLITTEDDTPNKINTKLEGLKGALVDEDAGLKAWANQVKFLFTQFASKINGIGNILNDLKFDEAVDEDYKNAKFDETALSEFKTKINSYIDQFKKFIKLYIPVFPELENALSPSMIELNKIGVTVETLKSQVNSLPDSLKQAFLDNFGNNLEGFTASDASIWSDRINNFKSSLDAVITTLYGGNGENINKLSPIASQLEFLSALKEKTLEWQYGNEEAMNNDKNLAATISTFYSGIDLMLTAAESEYARKYAGGEAQEEEENEDNEENEDYNLTQSSMFEANKLGQLNNEI